ncbi:hypothetical protein WJX81_008639 [Elliptochloris bilobata]|uniref:FHA domain-containing protein n=1 Tax=Elliptochloris bilobata TaxID=381761 RepID=A0AAW1QYB2_9CHLO
MAAPVAKRKAESLQDTFTMGESLMQSTAEQEAVGSAEDDSFLFPDPQNVSLPAEEPGGEAGEKLTETEVLQRRLQLCQELHALYIGEYWALAEELRTRHARFHANSAKPGAAAGASNGSTPLPGGAGERPCGDSSDAVGDELRGYGSDSAPPSFSETEEAVLACGVAATAPPNTLAAWRLGMRARMGRLARLEQAAVAAAARDMDAAGALAVLCGRRVRFLLRRTCVSIGRSTDSHGPVDVDLALEGPAARVSRQQARLVLRSPGRHTLANTGRRALTVDNRRVAQGEATQVAHLSLVEVGGIRLLLLVNPAALRRLASRSAAFSL